MADLQRHEDVSDNEMDYSGDENGLSGSVAGSHRPAKRKDTDKGDRRGGINRVNRACNNCRRMKMRCVGAEDPPCQRCRNGNLECVMEKPGRTADAQMGEDRIRSLETQVSSMQTTLSDLVSALRANMASNTSTTSSQTPIAHTLTPDYTHLAHAAVGSSGYSPSAVLDPAVLHRHPAAPPMPTANFWSPGAPSHSGFVNYGFPPRQDATATSAAAPAPANDPYVVFDQAGQLRGATVNPSASEAPSNPRSWPESSAVRKTDVEGENQLLSDGSRDGSVGVDDILAPQKIMNPLGSMSSMAGLVEAAVERAREEQGRSGSHANASPTKRDLTADEAEGSKNRPGKKARFSPSEKPSGPTIVESQNLPLSAGNGRGPAKIRRTHIHAYPDCVAEGIITEVEGKELMDIFYAGSSNFTPAFDKRVDTWDSLRIRSPFSITAICMVGARVRDGGNPPSEVQLACRHHAQRIAVGTLFNPVARIEAVQAMLLLSAYSDNGWLPGGHAVRMAIDMGVNRAFIQLLRTGMGKGKSREELEEERHLVVHSRVWFCLYLTEHQMAYGMGRPAILREDESIHQCRRLLEHPLSVTSDARLVSTVELTALRAPLHVDLTATPDLPITETILRRLKQANGDFDAWERYWDRILCRFRLFEGGWALMMCQLTVFAKAAVISSGSLVSNLQVVLGPYAEYYESIYSGSMRSQLPHLKKSDHPDELRLFVNSQLLRGIRESADIAGLSEEKRVLAIRAMRNAQRCLEICLRGENYRNGLRYAPHYTHVCAAFAASFLIRIARLFPHELNIKKTAKDVEELANLLSEVPAGRYSRSLRLILRRARRAKIIPAASRPASPLRNPSSLPTPQGRLVGQSVMAFSPSQLIDPSYYTPTPANAVGLSPQMAVKPGQPPSESPQSGTDLFEFDQLFAQETMQKAGIQFGEGGVLPLFLDGQSLGAVANAGETAPYVGIENFFLPAEIDHMLSGTSRDGSSQVPNSDIPLGGDVWW